jgi:EAL domain-containing protein (putative c-di-GMP-specific phosphodiesterase class I)
MEQGKPFSATDSAPVDYDAVCHKVRAAVEPARAHAVSLHDEHGDVLWLSESSMGPDEHNAVRDAIEAFSDGDGPPIRVTDLGDSRSAVLLRAVNGRRVMVGAIMIVMDARFVREDARGALKVITPRLQRALAQFAAMRPDGGATAPAAPPRAPAPPDMAAMRAPTGTAHKPLQGRVTPEIDRLHAAMRRSPIALHVQRLVPLTKGSPLKRYEVLLRSKSDTAPNAAPHAMLKAAVENGLGSMIDRRVVTELIGYLVHHPEIWRSTAVMFSVNLTTTALKDEHFIKFVELCLVKSSLPEGMIAFEVDTATALKLGDKIVEVAASLHRLGCPLVLDDFALKTECFDLLRLPGVRYVKLAAEITAQMRTDKLSQAAITAVVQMARVLGMHTVAKRTETAREQEWLTALGVDFVQSNSVSPPIAIQSLLTASNPKPVPAV